MLIYISGAITGDSQYKAKFQKAKKELEAKARRLSGGAYDPYGRGHHCTYNGSGQKGYWDSDDRWHAVKDDD